MSVILHYRVTNCDDKNMITRDVIYPADTPLLGVDKQGEQHVIMAKDAKGYRVFEDLSGVDYDGFNEEWLRLGYLTCMKKDPVKGIKVKVPKKATEIRKLFNYKDPKKASFWAPPGTYDLSFQQVPEEHRLSFLRGMFSAMGYVKCMKQGFIGLCWLKLEWSDILRDDVVDNIFESTPSTMEFNCDNIFFQNRDQIEWFIKNVGFIQEEKNEKARDLYRLKQRIVNKVIPVDNNYLLNHVVNHGEKDKYDDSLLEYDLEARDKDGNTPLLLALNRQKLKHYGYYHIQWLIEHGADLNAKNKKGETPRKIIESLGFVNLSRGRWFKIDCIVYEKAVGLQDLIDCLSEEGVLTSKNSIVFRKDDKKKEISEFMKVYLKCKEDPTLENRIRCYEECKLKYPDSDLWFKGKNKWIIPKPN